MSRATTTVLLLGDDWAERLSNLYGRVEAAQDDADRQARDETGIPQTMMEADDPVKELDAEYRALRTQAEADAVADRRRVSLRAPANRDWREFKRKHPPRTEGDEVKGDQRAGFNTGSVDAAFDLVHLMLEEPEFSSRGAFDEWADDHLSPGEWDVVVSRAFTLAVGARLDPKPSPASPTPRSEQS